MNVSNSQVRRATVDDLVTLRRLWQQNQLPAAELERRLTEFQIVETADGQVLGALGLQIAGSHGKIHHEAYLTWDLAPDLRVRLWERVHAVARTQGLAWLWVAGESAVFWGEEGFEVAGSEAMKHFPAEFAQTPAPTWLSLKLRDPGQDGLTAEQELELIQHAAAERARRARQIRVLRVLATIVALVVIGAILLACVFLLRNFRHPKLP